jgi:hypothetical protein
VKRISIADSHMIATGSADIHKIFTTPRELPRGLPPEECRWLYPNPMLRKPTHPRFLAPKENRAQCVVEGRLAAAEVLDGYVLL